jgi:hypothetical protein
VAGMTTESTFTEEGSSLFSPQILHESLTLKERLHWLGALARSL